MSHDVHQIFLVRGLARESRHWGQQFLAEMQAAYSKQNKSLRIETIDLPGCGRHSEMRSSFSIQSTADFAREKMREILAKEADVGLPMATHRRLVSMSLGGMVAASWVSRFPHDFHSCVLINSSFKGLSKSVERLRWDSWWRIPSILGSAQVELREKNILKWISNREDRREEVLAEWVQIQLTRPVSQSNILLQLFAGARFEAPKSWPIPLLVLASRQDRMVNSECSQAIANRYGAKILFHPTAGHDLPLDAGSWVATMIAEW
jgi:alpha-beta hydrolase superfamily lysophospholipase